MLDVSRMYKLPVIKRRGKSYSLRRGVLWIGLFNDANFQVITDKSPRYQPHPDGYLTTVTYTVTKMMHCLKQPLHKETPEEFFFL